MANLYNQYISQSYQGLLHFSTDTGSTAVLTGIQDGTGTNLGLYLNNGGDLKTTTSISSSLIEATNLVIKNKIEVTGSVDIDADVTASNAFIENNLIVSGTIFAKEVHTLIESSSIIFSSGSNILGDSIQDVQTLNGTVIVSGSEQITGSLRVLNDISSSTLNGMGNVSSFVTKMQAATSSLFVSTSQSLITASVNINVLTFTKGDNSQFSLTIAPIDFPSGSYLLTSSFNAYTQSNDAKVNSLIAATASYANSASVASQINTFSASVAITDNAQTVRIDGLASFTGSYATTGSNVFRGNQIITGSLTVTGSMVYSGSVRGQVFSLAIVSNTASMDCSVGNFFTIQLPSGSNTHISASNILPGETISLRITQALTGSLGNVSFSPSMKFPQAFPYFATPITGAVDILSFQTYDTSSIYGVAVNTMI